MIDSVARFAVGARWADAVKFFTTGADDKLTDATRIGSTLGILRRKPFINVIVGSKHHIGSVGMENFEQPLHIGLIAMSCARAKPRMMPVSQRAMGIARSEFLD